MRKDGSVSNLTISLDRELLDVLQAMDDSAEVT